MNMTHMLSREEIEDIVAAKDDEISDSVKDYLRGDKDSLWITGDAFFNTSVGEYMNDEYIADDVEIKNLSMNVTDYNVESDGDSMQIKGTVGCCYTAEALVLYQGDTLPTGDFIEGDLDISFELYKSSRTDHFTFNCHYNGEYVDKIVVDNVVYTRYLSDNSRTAFR